MENETKDLRWRITDRSTGQLLPGEFYRLSDAYKSVVSNGNSIWKYLFVLS